MTTSADPPSQSPPSLPLQVAYDPVTRAERCRQVANVVNLSTASGLFVALVGGAEVTTGPRGTLLATGYHLPIPKASAFTLGDVIISKKMLAQLQERPRLLRHESRHAGQYAWCLGLPMLPAYGLAAAWSWLRTGDPASRNVFERRAGLADGGYVERPLRRRARGHPPAD